MHKIFDITVDDRLFTYIIDIFPKCISRMLELEDFYGTYLYFIYLLFLCYSF